MIEWIRELLCSRHHRRPNLKGFRGDGGSADHGGDGGGGDDKELDDNGDDGTEPMVSKEGKVGTRVG